MEFNNFFESRHGKEWYSSSSCNNFFIKLKCKKTNRKFISPLEELTIFRKLTNAHSQATPDLISGGSAEDLDKIISNISPLSEYCFMIFPKVKIGVRINPADFLLSLVELQSLGIFPGDIKANNLGYIDDRMVFVDIDQALYLQDEVMSLGIMDYLAWADENNKKQYMSSIYKIFTLKKLTLRFPKKLIKDGKIQIKYVTRFALQNSTNNKLNSYHEINEEKLYSAGGRSENFRSSILANFLSDIEFNSVLDVGANLGNVGRQISKYKAVKVTAVEIDYHTASLGQTISNICKNDIEYFVGDLKNFIFTKKFDLVLLFSVLHHIKDYPTICNSLDRFSSQIMVEARLKESGKLLDVEGWQKTGEWDFRNTEDLMDYFRKLFPLKSKVILVGVSDKNRYLFYLK